MTPFCEIALLKTLYFIERKKKDQKSTSNWQTRLFAEVLSNINLVERNFLLKSLYINSKYKITWKAS